MAKFQIHQNTNMTISKLRYSNKGCASYQSSFSDFIQISKISVGNTFMLITHTMQLYHGLSIVIAITIIPVTQLWNNIGAVVEW